MSKKKILPPAPSFDLDDIIKELPVAQMFDSKPNLIVGSNEYQKATAESIAVDVNYAQVPKSDLEKLPANTYIRYVDINGEVKPGGRLKGITKSANGEMLLKFGKYNMAAKKYYAWNIRAENVATVYKYITVEPQNKTPKQVTVTQSNKEFKPIQEQEPKKSISPEEQFIGQLGGKILFDNGIDELKTRVESLENAVQKLSVDLQKIFILVKRVYTKQS